MKTLEYNGNFIGEECKMHDFLLMDKYAFLASYSYLTAEEYRATYDTIMSILDERGWEITMEEEFGEGETRNVAYEEY